MLFKKYFFSNDFVPFSKFFDSLGKLLRLLSALSIDKCPSCMPLKKTIGSVYLQKL